MQYVEMEYVYLLFFVDLNMVNVKLVSFGGSFSEMFDGVEVVNYCYLSIVRSFYLIVNML